MKWAGEEDSPNSHGKIQAYHALEEAAMEMTGYGLLGWFLRQKQAWIPGCPSCIGKGMGPLKLAPPCL
jgi:hypothetical protein